MKRFSISLVVFTLTWLSASLADAANLECNVQEVPEGSRPFTIIYSESNGTITVPEMEVVSEAKIYHYTQEQAKKDEAVQALLNSAGISINQVNKLDIYSANLDDDGGNVGILLAEIKSRPMRTEMRGYIAGMGGIVALRCLSQKSK